MFTNIIYDYIVYVKYNYLISYDFRKIDVNKCEIKLPTCMFPLTPDLECARGVFLDPLLLVGDLLKKSELVGDGKFFMNYKKKDYFSNARSDEIFEAAELHIKQRYIA
jgi:hypothetical protein